MDSALRCPFVIIPCGHGLCAGCLKRQTTCPICRGPVSGFAKNFSLLDQLALVSTCAPVVVGSQEDTGAEAKSVSVVGLHGHIQSFEGMTSEKTLEVDVESARELLLPHGSHGQGRSGDRPAGASRALAALVSVIGALLIGLVFVLLLRRAES